MYLLHRISHLEEFSRKLLRSGLLSIGYAELVKRNKGEYFTDLARSADEKVTFTSEFSKFGSDYSLEYFTKRRSYFLYNFLKLKTNDIVIIPDYKMITIAKVIGDPRVFSESENPDSEDIGFVVQVEILAENVLRDNFVSSSISSKLKYQATNLIISNDENFEEIDSILQNFKEGKEIHSFIDFKSKIIDQVHEYLLSNLKPGQFEKIVKWYFLKIGADNVIIPPKNKKNINNKKIADVDVIAGFDKLMIAICVQAKHHKNVSNIHGINQLIEYKYDDNPAFQGMDFIKWFITTADLRKEDETIAMNENIRVIKLLNFAEMLVDSGLQITTDIYV